MAYTIENDTLVLKKMNTIMNNIKIIVTMIIDPVEIIEWLVPLTSYR